MSMSKTEHLHIQIISTGGTIEKTYDELEGALENKTTQLEKRILSKLRLPYSSYEVTPILSKDSLFFDDNDRELVFQPFNKKSMRKKSCCGGGTWN